jgi:thiol-disulfide isomerase/thioredoxin
MKVITSEEELSIGQGVQSLYFYASWMPQHKKMLIMIDKVQEKYKDIEFIAIDVDHFKGLCKRFTIESIPMVLVFKDGAEAQRIAGITLTGAFRSAFADICNPWILFLEKLMKKNQPKTEPTLAQQNQAIQAAKDKATAEAMKDTVAGEIWGEIKDKNIEMFALPNQVVSMHVRPVPIEPSKLYLTASSTSVLPSLETAIGKKYVVELADRFITVSRAVVPLTKWGSMPFDEDDNVQQVQGRKGLKNVSSQKSIFDSIPKKPTQEDLERNVKRVQERNAGYKGKAADFAMQFKKIMADKTLSVNKTIFQKEMEMELLKNMVALAQEMNADINEPDSDGSMSLIIMLFTNTLSQRDKINRLEYAMSQLEKKFDSLDKTPKSE